MIEASLAADEVRPGDRVQILIEATVAETMSDGLLGADFLLPDGVCVSAKLADLAAAEQPLRETR